MEQQAWIRNLVTEHQAALCRYAYSLCGSAAAAQDAVQDTFLRLCRTDPASVRGHEAAWLYRVCRTRVLDRQRKDKPMTPLTPHEEAALADPGPGPAEATARRDAEGLLPRLLANLPERQQEVLRLKFHQNLSYRDIAAVTDLSESNVGYLLHTGLKALRTELLILEGASS